METQNDLKNITSVLDVYFRRNSLWEHMCYAYSIKNNNKHLAKLVGQKFAKILEIAQIPFQSYILSHESLIDYINELNEGGKKLNFTRFA